MNTSTTPNGQELDILGLVLNARIYDLTKETPLDHAKLLSRRLGKQVYLKREDLQEVFSFKIRGAYNKILKLNDQQRAQGVICASAGNHAQGVALSAWKLGISASIVMPRSTPRIKVEAVRSRGAKVILAGDSFDEAYEEARRLEAETGAVFIHPYDDLDVIAGQGTIALELSRQHPEKIDAVFVPVGGGGLIAGVAAFLKRVRPETRIIAVEASDSNAFERSFAAGERVRLEHLGLFADGTAVRQPGELSFEIAKRYVDEAISVDNDAICAAIKDVFEDTRSILEPAGALALAGLKAWTTMNGASGMRLVAITSGANMNFDQLRFVAERAELGESREAIFAVGIPEQAGSFKKFISIIGQRNITEFNYRYNEIGQDGLAQIFVGVAISQKEERASLLDSLSAEGYEAIDLSDDEMAKSHIRHMVGGRSPGLKNERLFRFVFPERPGALMRFLENMRADWNISLFHYRNHGSDFGRVLAGLQVLPAEHEPFQAFLDRLGYEYHEETSHPAYKLFLA